jgi:hypothetical protein
MANYAVYDPVKKKYVLTPEAQALAPQQSIAPRPTIRTGGFSSPQPQQPQQSFAPPPAGSINYRDPTTFPQPQQQGQSMTPAKPEIPRDYAQTKMPLPGNYGLAAKGVEALDWYFSKERWYNKQEIDPQTGQPMIRLESIGVPGEGTIAKMTAEALAKTEIRQAEYQAVKGIVKAAREGAVKAIREINQLGEVALTPGGAETLAQTLDAGKGLIPAATKAGSTIVTTKTATTFIGGLTTMVSKMGFGSLPLGFAISASGILGTGFGIWKSQQSKSRAGATQVAKDVTEFCKDVGATIPKLVDVGMTEEAKTLRDMCVDMRDAAEVAKSYGWFGQGQNQQSMKLQGYIDILNDNIITADQKLDKKEEEALQAKEDKAAAESKDPANYYGVNWKGSGLTGKDYDKQQADLAAPGIEQAKQDDQRAYDEKLAKEKAFSEDTATENVPGSTLGFGLLNSGGGIEFVDQDKASRAYFGKPFEELTPAQKKLLMLSKGMIK